MDQGYSSDMTFRDYLRVLFRQKAVVLLCLSVVSLVAFVGLTLETPKYQARVKMLISGEKQIEATYYQELAPGQRNAMATVTQSEVVISRPVMDRTVAALRLDQRPLDYEKNFASPLRQYIIDLELAKTRARLQALPQQQQQAFLSGRAAGELRSNVSVETIRDTNMFWINVLDFDPQAAAVKANVLSRAYVIFDLQQQLAELELRYGNKHPIVMQLRDNVLGMIENLSGQVLPDEQAIGPASVKIIEQASVPYKPNGPGNKVVFAMAALMGLFLGCILAFIFDYMDQTVKSPRDLEGALGLTHLGSVPRLRFHRKTLLKDMKKYNGKAPYPLALSSLADQVRLLVNDQDIKTILFAEPEETKGVFGIVADLGFSLAGFGDKRVLVVGANYRKKTSEKVPPGGFIDILTGKAAMEEVIENAGPNLWMLNSGRTSLNPLTFLDSPKARDLIAVLRSKFDLILIEGPDLKNYKDSLALASCVDGVILMVAESFTRLPVVRWTLKPLRARKCQVLGAVLNRRKFVIPKFIYDRV